MKSKLVAGVRRVKRETAEWMTGATRARVEALR